MKKIIGLVGETGSGKDSFCLYAKKLSKPVFCFRFSDSLTKALRIFFDKVDKIKKEDQQWLATVLRQRFGNNILGEAVKNEVKKNKKGIIILNGIRAWEEYKTVKNLGGKIVYITASSKVRWQRIRKRGEKKDDSVSFQKFLKMEKAGTEIFISKIGKKADFKIENSGSKQDFYRSAKTILKKL